MLPVSGALTFLDYFFQFFCPFTLPNVKSDLLMLPVSEALTFCGWNGPQFTCFNSTKVQILTQKQEKDHLRNSFFTCYTSTKVQILTQEQEKDHPYRLFQALASREIDERDFTQFTFALLVQKDKYWRRNRRRHLRIFQALAPREIDERDFAVACGNVARLVTNLYIYVCKCYI